MTSLMEKSSDFIMQQIEHTQVPNGTRPGARGSKLHLLQILYTEETSRNLTKGQVWKYGQCVVKSLIGEGLLLYVANFQNVNKHS